MNVRQGLFGSRPNGAEQSPRPYRPSAPYPPPREEAAPLMGRVGRMEATPRRSVPPPSQYGGAPRGRGDPSRKVSLRIAKVEDKTLANQFIFGNKCAVSPQDFPEMEENTDFRLLLNGKFILTARSLNSFQPGCISLSDPQRTWLSVGLMDTIVAEYYDPRHESSNYLLGYTELEVGFASLKKVTDVPLDQDDLEARFLDQFDGQFLTVGQKIIMDYKSLLLSFVVKACDVVPVMLEDKTVTKDKGKLNSKTHITFFKDAKSILKLKGSAKRPATNSIVGPNFKFENMGIGGLDKEFSQLFRRAFASRVFPPDVIQDMGIQHVKGILLYGPPGTGKTLIARQIGKMLNAREPKIINGPEVLNKFVGQSEENIRKLFADAEKEYKEKGDESGLHIIIFDELDAVCKQRGSGAGGGTGVGDSVVNQLLSKLDGVEPLNNILLIGMTNRKDMIDDALLRPGRIEVQLEIMLPDEFGRQQILKIHLAKMVASKVLGDDVDVEDLAARTKNFSGAEIAGLVKSASSYALNRHIVVGTQAQIDDNLADIKVTYNDFNEALKEVKPAFGRADESLEKAAPHGIIHFAPHIQKILDRGNTQIASLKRAKKGTSVTSLLLYGPRGSGRTAMASRIAGESGFPFIKYVNAGDLLGMADAQKADYVKKAFTDAYRSPQSVIILDDIERIISWVRIGPLFSSGVVQTLMVQLSISPPTGHSLLIIGTTEERYALQQLDLVKYFTLKFEIPYITRYDELISFLRDDEAFGNDEAREDAVAELRERLGSRQLAVGVKQVIDAVDLAIATGGNTARGFAENLLGQVDVLGQGED